MKKRGRAIVVFSGRFPSEKADSLFAHENARAFAELGLETIVLAPRRFGREHLGDTVYKVSYLPTVDLSKVPILWEIASYLNLLFFSLSLYVWLVRHAQKNDFVLCNEPLPLLAASYALPAVLFEIHVVPPRHEWFYRWIHRRAALALPITAWNAQYAERLNMPRERILIARSAVDTKTFCDTDRRAARAQLDLPQDKSIALYTGHLYEWKGANTLAEAAHLAPDVHVVFVGGTAADVRRFRTQYGSNSNVAIVGHVPHADVPLWQAAADVLVLPNSAKAEISVRHTSPMKLFEYMASERPILASDLPSIREVLTEKSGHFAKADDPESFAAMLREILKNKEEAGRRARAARTIAEANTWHKRAKRIFEKVEELLAT